MTLRGRTIAFGLVALFTLMITIPSLLPRSVRESSVLLPDQGLNLGLDLQGGIYLLLGIDIPKAIAQRTSQAITTLDEIANDEKLEVGTGRIEGESVLVCGGRTGVLAGLMETRFPNFELTAAPDGCQRMSITPAARRQITKGDIAKTIEVLKNRLDSSGVGEQIIAPKGDDRILVQLPGFTDRQAAINLVSKAAFLEFKAVLESAPSKSLLEANLKARYPGYDPAKPETLPAELEIVFERNTEVPVGKDNPDANITAAYLVTKEAVLTGSRLEDARVDLDRAGRPVVAFSWNAEGGRIFGEFTGKSIGKQMAVIKDGVAISAPVINDRITRNGQISGRFTNAEAQTFAVQLRSGALPTPLIIEQERTVGPALGEDSIRYGFLATGVGALAVVIFMLIYYKSAGAIANIAVIFNVLMILAIMGSIQATLTLPGIAGLVLTVGMAVDANVIIYERLREELRAGKHMKQAVAIAFSKSTRTIWDANLTTFIAALILYYFGQGPVQGFGVTLMIGIGTSVYCALVVTHLLIDLLLARNEDALRV